MRIAVDARLYGLENGGIGRYPIELIRNLSKIDRDNQYTVLLREKYYKSLNLPGNWEKVLADFRQYSLKEQVALPKILKNISPDLVHFPHFNVPIAYRGRYVVTIHDLLIHKVRGKSTTTLPLWKYGIKRVGYKQVFKKAATRASGIIVPSHFTKSELLGYYKNISGGKVRVIYEGVDKSFSIRKAIAPNVKYFVYVGNSYPHKNLKRAIEAIFFLNKSTGKKAKLVFVGPENKFSQRLEKFSRELGAEDYVEFAGFVDDKKLRELLSGAAAFVFPSIYEGFGLPGLEAMAAGTLVLASDIPVFREIYKKHAVYFNPYDFSALEQAMREALMLDEKTIRKKTQGAKKFVARYSWQKMAEETLKIYEHTIA